ncbi:angiotensin-converting enzyme-like [Phlebotomus argentipes]|uniref:angiotensin-converting enzyme-like n=1 Tax=Phlebotomus argentipes TaxID=94469 RepID=UPI002892DED5|nr:angiotensin-converting enzyme-like [Phlebotomus argentipes]
MAGMTLLAGFCLVLCAVKSAVSGNSSQHFSDVQEEDARRWFRLMDAELKSLNKHTSIIAWELSVNPSESLGEEGVLLNGIRTKWQEEKCDEALVLLASSTEPKMRRAVNLLCRGPRFSPDETQVLSRVIADMQDTYTDTQICLPKDVNACLRADSLWDFTFVRAPADGGFFWLNLRDFIEGEAVAKASDYFAIIPPDTRFACFDGEPDLERVMTGDFSVLGCQPTRPEIIYHWAWEAWRMAVGVSIGNIYPSAVALMNRGARKGGYRDMGEVWREELEVDNLEEVMWHLWEDVKPFYSLLHAVVRHFLRQEYRIQGFSQHGKIPAHILGNMWSQNWASLHKLLMPDVKLDLEANIRATNWTALDMVAHAEDFFTSLGLRKMTHKFWRYSQFEKNNTTRCHGTAANMFMPDDYRMIVCSEKSLEDLYVIHHEFGHLAYYSAYRNQPTIFQDGTNSAFQEAVGDALFNGVMTPQHLNRMSLLPDEFLLPNNNSMSFRHLEAFNNSRNPPRESQIHNIYDISILLRVALAKIPQIPFEYIVDVFRWSLFRGDVDFEDANDYFWALSELHQGIQAPGRADRRKMFDAGAKFHVADNTPYVRYFLASIIQMQIFKGLCQETVFDRVRPDEPLPMPLHRCDIYGSKRAGRILRKSLSLGASVHWTTVMEILTGSRKISAKPLLEYYKPLIDWLHHTIDKLNIPVGW